MTIRQGMCLNCNCTGLSVNGKCLLCMNVGAGEAETSTAEYAALEADIRWIRSQTQACLEDWFGVE
jgi:hypothetical protein